MSNEKKPRVMVGTIGHVSRDKSTLTAALIATADPRTVYPHPFDRYVTGPTVRDLIDAGYLAERHRIAVGDELALPGGATARVTQVCDERTAYAGIVEPDNTVRQDMVIDVGAWVRHSIAQGRY